MRSNVMAGCIAVGVIVVAAMLALGRNPSYLLLLLVCPLMMLLMMRMMMEPGANGRRPDAPPSQDPETSASRHPTR